MFSKLAVAAAVVAAATLAAPPAMAITWYTKSSPLKAHEDGVVQAQAYGDFKNYNGVSARSYSWQYDARAGGDSIYVETHFGWYGPDYSCGSGSNSYNTCWHFEQKKQTTRTNSAAWIKLYTAQTLDPQASSARGSMKVCEDQSWSPDPCSAAVLRTFAY